MLLLVNKTYHDDFLISVINVLKLKCNKHQDLSYFSLCRQNQLSMYKYILYPQLVFQQVVGKVVTLPQKELFLDSQRSDTFGKNNHSVTVFKVLGVFSIYPKTQECFLVLVIPLDIPKLKWFLYFNMLKYWAGFLLFACLSFSEQSKNILSGFGSWNEPPTPVRLSIL